MRRFARLLGAPALLAGMVVGPLSPAAHGADGYKGTFGAVASADAVRVTWIVPHAPASDTVLDLGGPSAQASLDSIGGSQAFASFPYPGENTVTAPALIAGASGGQINLPSYPFWVGSTYPVAPKAESGSGPYSIKAESTDTSSESSASVGLDSNGQAALGLAKSHASAVSAPDGVTADAATQVTGFAAGPLRIGQVVSTAKAVFSAAGMVQRTADTRITGSISGSFSPSGQDPNGGDIAELELDLTLTPGDWCRFCPAKLACPLLTALFGASVKADASVLSNMSSGTLARNYALVAAVKHYIKALEELVLKRLMHGDEIEGYKLVNKKANRVFSEEGVVEAKITFGPEAYTAPKLKTPAEIDKIGAAGKKFTKQWAYSPQTGQTVAPTDDPRPAINVRSGQEAFASYQPQQETNK